MTISIKLADNESFSCNAVVSATTTAILSFRMYCDFLIIASFENLFGKPRGHKVLGVRTPFAPVGLWPTDHTSSRADEGMNPADNKPRGSEFESRAARSSSNKSYRG